MAGDKLRVGFLGAGRIADLQCLGYLAHPRAEIAAVCDLDEGLARGPFGPLHSTTESQVMVVTIPSLLRKSGKMMCLSGGCRKMRRCSSSWPRLRSSVCSM